MAKSKKTKTVQPRYSVRPTTKDELVVEMIKYRGRLQEIDTSLITDMSFLYRVLANNPGNSGVWTNDDFNGIDQWDTSNVTNMSYMFYECSNFNQDISGWNTGNVTDMGGMFASCINFNQPLNSWNTSNVTNMREMFNRCYVFNQDLDNWDVRKVTNTEDMFLFASEFNGNVDGLEFNALTRSRNMFKRCLNFNKPMANCKFPLLEDASNMFDYCKKFNQDLPNWDLSSLVRSFDMFKDCTAFRGDISGWKLPLLKYATDMFNNCYNLNSDISNWRLPSILVMDRMFYSCSSLRQNLDSWNIPTTVSQVDAFKYCPTDPVWYEVFIPNNKSELVNKLNYYKGRLQKIKTNLLTDLSGVFSRNTTWSESSFNGIETWDVSNVTNMSNLFSETANFNKDISGWDVSNVTDMSNMFYRNKKFNKPLNSWNTTSLTTCRYMFAESVYNQPLNNWNMSNVNNIDWMFYYSEFNNDVDGWDLSSCTSLREVFRKGKFNQPLNNWNVSNVTNFQATFLDNIVFNQPLDNWNVSSAVYFDSLFKGATSFNQPLNTWNTPNLISLNRTFYGATSFNQDLSNWNTSKLNTMYQAFYNATSFNGDISTWDTSSLTTLQEAFYGCTSFNCDISGWNMKSMYNLQSAFEGCTSFNQPIGKWVFGRYINYVDRMLYGCTSWFHSLDSWAGTNTGVTNGTTKSNVFYGSVQDVKAIWYDNIYYPEEIDQLASDVILCKGNLSRIKTMMMTDMSDLFSVRVPGSKSWSNSDFNGISTWNMELVENISGMIKGCVNFNQNISSWNTINVRRINSFAEGCTSFNQNLDGWYYQNMEDRSASTKAFLNCPTQPVWYGVFTPKTKDELIALVADKSITLNKIDTKFITDMANIFQGSDRTDTEFNGIETWDVSKVTTLDYMFDGAVNFNKDISGWSVNNVTSAEGTFRDCINYNQQLNTWNTGNFVNTSLMLQGCQSYNQPMDAWNTTKLENISNMFNGCISLTQDFDMWDVRTVTDMTSTFEQVTQQPWWYGLLFERDIVLNTPTDIDFSALYPLTNGKQLSITSNSTDLSIVNQYGNTFQFTSNVLGNYVPLVECNGGMINIKVNIINPDVNYSTDVKAQYFKVLDFAQLYPSINITSLVISNESAGLTVENVQNYEYRFKADAEGVYTADISVNNVYNGTLTFNSSKLIQDFTINSKTDEVTRKDFNTEYTGYDVTTMTIVSNDANLEVTKISDGIFEFRPLSDGTFTATIELLGLTSTATVISNKVLSDITDNGTATIRQEIDIRNFITNIDFSKLSITSSDANFKVRKVSDIIYELLALVSGTFTAEIRLENETSTLTYTADKLLSDETRELSSNRIYDFDFNRLYPNSVFNNIEITADSTYINITKLNKTSFNIEGLNVGIYTCIININGEESNLVLNVSKLIEDKTLFIYNKTFKLNFNTMYPNGNLGNVKVVPITHTDRIQVLNVSSGIFELTFYEKGTYNLSISIGNLTSTFTMKVFFIDKSKIEIYQYPDSFINELIKPQLFNSNLYIYQYNQYGGIEWVSKFFSYMNEKMKKYLDYIYLWFVLKTNQQLDKSKMDYINDEKYYFYINFLEKYFDGINKAFGSSSAITFWDNQGSEWNDNKTRWDDTIKTSDLSTNKFKCILRYIKDISNKTFNLNRFIQFCNEFVNCDITDPADKIELFVDETSFENPSSIVIYSPVISDNTNILLSMVTSSYKYLMPMNEITIRQKIKSKSKSSRSRTKKDK